MAAPNDIATDQDSTPIGPALRALVILDKDSAAHTDASDGIDVASVPRLWDVRDQIAADLQPFLGQNISRKLIAEIEATIAKRYRALNYPFVALSTPEQEITHGILQIRAVEFHVGELSTKGVSPSEEANLKSRVALKRGDAINAASLGDDLNWINRYPFRQVQAVFTPAKTPGQTDLILSANNIKPWQVYAGYDNSGSPTTGLDRMFIGGAVGNLLGRDSVLAYQGTGSRNAFHGLVHPDYVSHAFSYALPVARRTTLEASYDHVETNQDNAPFAVRLKINEGTLGLRVSANQWLGAAGLSDLRFGIAAKHQQVTTFFGGTNVYEAAVQDYATYIGFHHAEQSQNGSTTFDITLHAAPGDLNDGNSNTQAILYSQGRLDRAGYTYVGVNYDHFAVLGKGLTLKSQVVGQLATHPLPRTEQAGLGGASLVRGYSLDDGAYDSVLILRNELRADAIGSTNLAASPFVFLDVGHGRDNYTRHCRDVTSMGVGADMSLTRHATLSVVIANPLKRSGSLRAGTLKTDVSLGFRF